MWSGGGWGWVSVQPVLRSCLAGWLAGLRCFGQGGGQRRRQEGRPLAQHALCCLAAAQHTCAHTLPPSSPPSTPSHHTRRYTECRLQAAASAMLLSDLDADTVDFIPNFDASVVGWRWWGVVVGAGLCWALQ